MNRRLFVAVLVLAALYAGYCSALYRMVEAKLNSIRKQGYPVTFAELAKWYVPVPPSENAAVIYEDAFWRDVRWDHERLHPLPLVGDAKQPKGDKAVVRLAPNHEACTDSERMRFCMVHRVEHSSCLC